MPRSLLQIFALLPIPIILVLVYWAGQRPIPAEPLTQGTMSKGAVRSAPQHFELPSGFKPGWKLEGKAERYDQKTLFDRIDGAAPAYLRAGFVYSMGAEYKKAGLGEPVVVDVYNMGSPNQGLGMYSTERDLSYKFIDVGNEGYLATGSLNFWSGPFYIKLAGYGEGEAMDLALMEVAQGIVAALPKGNVGTTGKELLSLLPVEDRLAHSDGYCHPPLGEVDGLEQLFYADYKGSEEGKVYRLFVVREKSPEQAKARLNKAKAYFEKDGAKVQLDEDGQLSTYTIIGSSTASLILTKGPYIFGALDLPDASSLPKIGASLRQAFPKKAQP